MTPLDMSVIVFGIFAILFGVAVLIMLALWPKASQVAQPATHQFAKGPGDGVGVPQTTEIKQ
jgi:hypothetical protein